RQGAAAAAMVGVQLQPDAHGPNPPRDFDGVAVTYARVASDPGSWAAQVSPDTLVVVDEAHHLGEGPGLGHELSTCVWIGAALAAALRDPLPLRRHSHPGRALRRRRTCGPRRLL